MDLTLKTGKLGTRVVELRKALFRDRNAYTDYLASQVLYKHYIKKYPMLKKPVRPFTMKDLHVRQVELNKLRRRLGLGTVDVISDIRAKKREILARHTAEEAAQ